jgi:cystathionine beta-lyase/cystathionine gamma-synthase
LPIHQTSRSAGEPGVNLGPTSRTNNPTREREWALAELEEWRTALSSPRGWREHAPARVSQPNDEIVAPNDVYGGPSAADARSPG